MTFVCLSQLAIVVYRCCYLLAGILLRAFSILWCFVYCSGSMSTHTPCISLCQHIHTRQMEYRTRYRQIRADIRVTNLSLNGSDNRIANTVSWYTISNIASLQTLRKRSSFVSSVFFFTLHSQFRPAVFAFPILPSLASLSISHSLSMMRITRISERLTWFGHCSQQHQNVSNTVARCRRRETRNHTDVLPRIFGRFSFSFAALYFLLCTSLAFIFPVHRVWVKNHLFDAARCCHTLQYSGSCFIFSWFSVTS